jgi:hypothetical protein
MDEEKGPGSNHKNEGAGIPDYVEAAETETPASEEDQNNELGSITSRLFEDMDDEADEDAAKADGAEDLALKQAFQNLLFNWNGHWENQGTESEKHGMQVNITSECKTLNLYAVTRFFIGQRNSFFEREATFEEAVEKLHEFFRDNCYLEIMNKTGENYHNFEKRTDTKDLGLESVLEHHVEQVYEDIPIEDEFEKFPEHFNNWYATRTHRGDSTDTMEDVQCDTLQTVYKDVYWACLGTTVKHFFYQIRAKTYDAIITEHEEAITKSQENTIPATANAQDAEGGGDY